MFLLNGWTPSMVLILARLSTGRESGRCPSAPVGGVVNTVEIGCCCICPEVTSRDCDGGRPDPVIVRTPVRGFSHTYLIDLQ